MFQRLLVPLDGSQRAERAIPVAARIARACGGAIVFVQVIAPSNGIGAYGVEPAIGVEPSLFEIQLDEATSYLSSVAAAHADELQGISTESTVEVGIASQAIFSTVHLEHIDLIVMCSHGDTGLKRWIFHRVALQAVRHSPIPVLVLGGHGGEELAGPVSVMVPLDGSPLAESALEPALQLITALSPTTQATLHLLSVIDAPGVTRSMRSQGQRAAGIGEPISAEASLYLDSTSMYLSSVVRRLQEGPQALVPVHVKTSVMISPDVPGTIIKQAEDDGCTLLALATHGRAGVQRLVLGSVTDHILGATQLPLLVMRPREPRIEQQEATDLLKEQTEVPV